jgi:MarR family transcriptional regulator, lower aerobic nicotinate degradation pathway regulator
MQTILSGQMQSVNSLAKAGSGRYLNAMTGKYQLDDQIGFVLRRVTQRHLALFSDRIPTVTTTQFAVLARLAEVGPQSQNLLGRSTAMDAATIKGVVDRLARQGLVATAADPDDRRKMTVSLTSGGQDLFHKTVATALDVSHRTLEPLSAAEQALLFRLLTRLT